MASEFYRPCSQCARPVIETASFCGHCGARQPAEKTRAVDFEWAGKMLTWVFGAIAAVSGIVVICLGAGLFLDTVFGAVFGLCGMNSPYGQLVPPDTQNQIHASLVVLIASGIGCGVMWIVSTIKLLK